MSGDSYTRAHVGNVPKGLLYLFLAFQLVDQTVLPILLATFVFTPAKRHPTLLNVCATWILTGIFGSLLFYTGTHVGPEPPKALCITQATLLDGVLPMNSTAILALMLHTYWNVCRPKMKHQQLFTHILLVMPYTVFFCFAMTASILMMHHPEEVSRARHFFYCSFNNQIFSNAFVLYTMAMLAATLGFQLAIGIFMYKNWRALRQTGSIDTQTISRIIFFASYVFLAFILCLFAINGPTTPIPDLLTASVGTMLAVSIGSHPDIYRVWFCRPIPTPPPIEPVPPNTVMDVRQFYREGMAGEGPLDRPVSYVPSIDVGTPGSSDVAIWKPPETGRKEASNNV